MVTKTKLIKNIDNEQWNKFVAIAKNKGIKVGDLINDLILIFLEKTRQEK